MYRSGAFSCLAWQREEGRGQTDRPVGRQSLTSVSNVTSTRYCG